MSSVGEESLMSSVGGVLDEQCGRSPDEPGP